MIIGIDPGLAKTGFCIIDDAGGIRCVRYGLITTPPDAQLQIRVQTIFREIQESLDTH